MMNNSKIFVAICLLVSSLQTQSLQSLDDESLSEVVGQSRGLTIKSEHNVDIDSFSYTDDDGLNLGSPGTLSLSGIKIRTTPSKPMDMDMELKDHNGKKAVWLTIRSLSTSLSVNSIAINGKSLGGFVQLPIFMGINDTATVRLYAGGQVGNGLTLDLVLPTSLRMQSSYVDDSTRLTQTMTLKDPNNPTRTALNLEGITLDIDNDGLRVGLPKISNGYIAMENMKVKNSVFGSSILRNININPGAFLVLKNAKRQNEIGIELDATLKKGSNFEMASVSGELVNATPSSSNFVNSARVSLVEDLRIKGLRMNVDGNRGLIFDFSPSGGVQAKVEIDNVYLYRGDQASRATQASLGRAVLDMSLGSQTYLQVQGH